MRDITHKQITLRTATAIGVIFCSPATIELIQKNELPKGNLFDVARAAAFLIVCWLIVVITQREQSFTP